MTEPELKPLRECPFCGCKANLIQRGNEFTTRTVEIKCSKCRVNIKNGAIHQSMDWLTNKTVEAWNKRV
jgi:hypothetical protein